MNSSTTRSPRSPRPQRWHAAALQADTVFARSGPPGDLDLECLQLPSQFSPPEGTGASISPPSTAVAIGTGMKCTANRARRARTARAASPTGRCRGRRAGLFCGPFASPSPATRMREPSSTPAGMRTCKVRSRRTWPLPRHCAQGSSTSLPKPPQRGQVRSIEKKPWLARTRPKPKLAWRRTGGGAGARAAQPERFAGLRRSMAAGTLISTSALWRRPARG